ncbi:MAG TPA: PilN domain-containing protein [Candidatus Binatia bacterium]|jgi:type IV pilus assembly protein PilN
MIRINLLSVREIKAEIGRRQDLAIAAVSLGATLAVILVVFLYQFYRSNTLEREVASLRKEIAGLEGDVKEVRELEKTNAELTQKIKVIDDLRKKKIGPVRVMESLSEATPGRLWLTEFKETSGTLSMTGMAVDNQTVADFLKGLSTSDYFKDVELVETTQVEQDKVLLKKFSVKSRLLYQPGTDLQAKAETGKTGTPGGSKKP